MKVFISWSGPRSNTVAQALRQWLPDVIQSVEPWMSAEDIEAGARWNNDISQELSETRFGIICVTPENQHAPWILFEAGALAKTLKKTYVCPYLIALSPSQLEGGPLTQFQAKQANESQTWELVRTINRAFEDAPLPEDRLQKIFEKWWPELEQALENLPEPEGNQQAKRPIEDMMGEVLELVRQMSRSSQSVSPEPIRIGGGVGGWMAGEGRLVLNKEDPNLTLRQTSPQVVVPEEQNQ